MAVGGKNESNYFPMRHEAATQHTFQEYICGSASLSTLFLSFMPPAAAPVGWASLPAGNRQGSSQVLAACGKWGKGEGPPLPPPRIQTDGVRS